MLKTKRGPTRPAFIQDGNTIALMGQPSQQHVKGHYSITRTEKHRLIKTEHPSANAQSMFVFCLIKHLQKGNGGGRGGWRVGGERDSLWPTAGPFSAVHPTRSSSGAASRRSVAV